MKKIELSPSIMCANLTNLEQSIKEIEGLGIDNLHIDLIDGSFSPSIPLGIDTVKKLRDLTDMNFDAHVMSLDNEFFIEELTKIGMQSISFHYESSLHVDRYINLIRESGAEVGIALNPSTSLSVLDYILPEVDMVVLMLINPGFATNKNEQQISYATKKIKDLRNMIDEKKLNTKIQVDGRVSIDTIPDLIKAGADDLVLGSTGLFIKGNSLEENKKILDKAVEKGLI